MTDPTLFAGLAWPDNIKIGQQHVASLTSAEQLYVWTIQPPDTSLLEPATTSNISLQLLFASNLGQLATAIAPSVLPVSGHLVDMLAPGNACLRVHKRNGRCYAWAATTRTGLLSVSAGAQPVRTEGAGKAQHNFSQPEGRLHPYCGHRVCHVKFCHKEAPRALLVHCICRLLAAVCDLAPMQLT